VFSFAGYPFGVIEAIKLGHPSARGAATVGCGGFATLGANGHGLFFPGCMGRDLVFGLTVASLGKLLRLCLFFLVWLCALGRGRKFVYQDYVSS
jgi:hypothetical protein